MSGERQGFFARWSQRKAEQSSAANNVPRGGAEADASGVSSAEQVRQASGVAAVGQPLQRASVPVVGSLATPGDGVTLADARQPPALNEGAGDAEGHVKQPPPTLDDVAALTPDSDFSAFVGRDVAPAIKNAAMKKLFADPHFNVMDGLDIYIDDYSIPSPLSAQDLKKMVAAQFVKLVEEEPPPSAAGAASSQGAALATSPEVVGSPAVGMSERPADGVAPEADAAPVVPMPVVQVAAAERLAEAGSNQAAAPPAPTSSPENPLP